MGFRFEEGEHVQEGFPLIPDGTTLDVIITKAAEKETKRGGFRLALTVQVDEEGDYYGWDVFGGYNLDVPGNDKATKIGKQQTAHLCRVVGLPTGYDDPQDLVGKGFRAKFKINPAQNGYQASNDFRVLEDTRTTTLDPAAAAKLAAKAKAAVADVGKLRAKASADKTKAAGFMADLDDDVPF